MNICFLLTHVPDPKTNRRIAVFQKEGKVSVICTRRKSQDIWEPVIKNVDYNIFDIDLPPSSQLLKRVIISRDYQEKALKKLEEMQPNVIYADGLDSLIIASKYKKRHSVTLFYDVADLRESYIEEPTGIIKRTITHLVKVREKSCFKEIDYLVITSPKFYDIYYHKLINKDKVIFIPNAPDKEVFKNYKRKSDGVFTVGFIGGIRYLAQMMMLVDAAEKVKCNVLFAGAGGTSQDFEQITEYCKNKPWVTFSGKYDYNTEIAKLYGSVDCVYAVYDADNANVRIALPNKLYESILCGLPIIVAKNTYLSELVKEWGVGVAVDHKDIRDLLKILDKLMKNKDFYDTLSYNCNKLNFIEESSLLKNVL